MLQISIQRGVQIPPGSWVLTSAPQARQRPSRKTIDRIPFAWPLHLSVKWEIKHELLVQCINSWGTV
jgi:hypothetical protein